MSVDVRLSLLSVVLFAAGYVFRWLAHGRAEKARRKAAADYWYDRGWDDRSARSGPDGSGQSVMLDGSIPLWEGQEATRQSGPALPTLAADDDFYDETISNEQLLARDVPRPAVGPQPTGPGHPPAADEGHWYANGLHYIADWRTEWHADAAAWDEYAAWWAEDARRRLTPGWLAAYQLLEA